MGMLLRRHTRTPEYAPTVNGKTVDNEPKKRSLTKEKKDAQQVRTTVGYMPNGVK